MGGVAGAAAEAPPAWREVLSPQRSAASSGAASPRPPSNLAQLRRPPWRSSASLAAAGSGSGGLAGGPGASDGGDSGGGYALVPPLSARSEDGERRCGGPLKLTSSSSCALNSGRCRDTSTHGPPAMGSSLPLHCCFVSYVGCSKFGESGVTRSWQAAVREIH